MRAGMRCDVAPTTTPPLCNARRETVTRNARSHLVGLDHSIPEASNGERTAEKTAVGVGPGPRPLRFVALLLS